MAFHALSIQSAGRRGRSQSPREGGAEGDEGDVLAFLLDVGLAERNLIVAFGDSAFVEGLALSVELLAFEEDDRVGACESGVEQSLCVVRRDRRGM